MRTLKSFLVLLVLALPSLATADARDVPGTADWYFFVDIDQMRSGGPGQKIYDWLRDDVLKEIHEDANLDLEKELDSLTVYSSSSDRAVAIFDGKFSQATRDIVMAFIASGGDIDPQKSSGKTYFHYAGDEDKDDDIAYDAGNIEFQIESLAEEAFISMDVKNKIIVTATESHMKTLLASNGKAAKSRNNKGALLVMSARQPLIQAGLKAEVIGDDDWDSNILRNTKEIAILVAAAADKLSLQAELVTTEAEMAESLASVARGLISLASFDDDMDDEMIVVLRQTVVEAKGNNLKVSLAVDPGLVVATLGD